MPARRENTNFTGAVFLIRTGLSDRSGGSTGGAIAARFGALGQDLGKFLGGPTVSSRRRLEHRIRLQPAHGEQHLEARALAEKAVACDPNHAWATLGFTHWWDGRLGYTGNSNAKFRRASEYAERATALDDTVSWVIGLNTTIAAAQGRHNEGVALARHGFELYPGNADVRAFLAIALIHAGDSAAGVD